MKSVLIHGAAGFVAKALVRLLAETGWDELILVDRNPVPQERLDSLAALGVRVSSRSSDRLRGLPGLDAVTHAVCLAGATSVDAALSNPAPAVEGNLQIAVDLSEWLRTQGRPIRTVYVSSDEVLGESFEPLGIEAALKPTQPYAASKAAAELIIHNFRDVYDLKIVTLRACNLVGPGQKAPKLLPVAVRRLVANRPVPIHGSGEQLREWLAVEDFCSAILLLLEEHSPSGIYQAASGVHISVNDVAEIIADALGKELHTEEVPDRLIQDMCYAMDWSKLRDLGWNPKLDPREAIHRAAQLLANELSEGQSVTS